MGDPPDAPHMARARELTPRLGGAEACNTFTRFYFACLGQVSFDSCPSIPPEVVFLPKRAYFNLYNVSAWTRTMILPLGIVTTLRPVRRLPDALGIRELYADYDLAHTLGMPNAGLPRGWRDAFLHLDRALKLYERFPVPGLRRRAIEAAEKWLLERMATSEGLGAIFPPMVYMLIVLQGAWGTPTTTRSWSRPTRT